MGKVHQENVGLSPIFDATWYNSEKYSAYFRGGRPKETLTETKFSAFQTQIHFGERKEPEGLRNKHMYMHSERERASTTVLEGPIHFHTPSFHNHK